ncbi:arabinose efflux permease family protein [Caulobacter sp. AP07]|uniref:MFS transporter n=1 Tax=Caulobacter sp. AP07 TaxID=1144304 RepID=UPI000271E395|nr:MFS transporter [Caulobacter sp. AP07]EJL34228.1 arabinose efflux permease family protein [Caulobacter sp. AP07]
MTDTTMPAATAASPSAPMSAWRRTRAILGGSAGNLVEWYDWFAYAAFSIYFAKIFFPKGDQTAQLMQTAAIFAVGFGARPVGAWLMGLYADRKGRKAGLTLAVGLMCAGSLVIALCPGHAAIGDAAPVILLLARLLQGLSVGGEYGASATYMSEMAGKQRRGFWSSFQYVTLIMGQLVAALVLVILQNTLDKQQLADWGWRIPFFVGAALAVVVFWIRTGIEESVSHQNVTRHDPISTRQVASVGGLLLATVAAMIVGFTAWSFAGAAQGASVVLLLLTYVALAAPLVSRHPKQTLAIIGLTAAGSLAFYAYTTYMLKFLTNTAGFSKATAGAINLATLAGFMLVQPLFGWLSDKLGRKTMLVFAFGVGALIAWPVFTLTAKAASPQIAFGLIFAALVVQSGYTSISAVVKAELFPTHVRALGVALPYAIGNAAFGGTAEYVALWFKREGMESGFYLYVSAIMAVGLVVALLLRDTGKHSLILED